MRLRGTRFSDILGRVEPARQHRRRIAWVLLLLGGGCATAEAPAPPRRADVVAKETRVADWNRLATALSALATTCGAVGKSRGGEATGIAFPAECLFGRDGGSVITGAGPAVAIIARELKRVADREFWIAARATGQNTEATRLGAARAAALVSALVAEGVAPDRLAAVMGFGESQATVYDGPPALASAALVEIIVAPSRAEASR